VVFFSQENLGIHMNANESNELRHRLAGGISPSFEMPPIMVQGWLHWRPQLYQDNSRLLLFDTVAELFGWMRPPRVRDGNRWVQVEGDQLLEINGRLAMIVVAPTTVAVFGSSRMRQAGLGP
jgi:hypothetical protein